MIAPPTEEDIVGLFDEVWPRMRNSGVFRDKCIGRQDIIGDHFVRHAADVNQLLGALDNIPDVGLVIASGLIFAANKDATVPFDKFTMGWSLELGILPDNQISKGTNYQVYCGIIKRHH